MPTCPCHDAASGSWVTNRAITAFSDVEGKAVAEGQLPTTQPHAVAQLLPATPQRPGAVTAKQMTQNLAWAAENTPRIRSPAQSATGVNRYRLDPGSTARTLTSVPSGSGFPRNLVTPLRTTALTSGMTEATPPTSVAVTAFVQQGFPADPG